MESDLVKLTLGLAWPLVALVYATLTFFLVCGFLFGQLPRNPPAGEGAPVGGGPPLPTDGDPRIIWWATFLALAAAILALVATLGSKLGGVTATFVALASGLLLLSLLGSLVKFFQYTTTADLLSTIRKQRQPLLPV